MSEFLSVPEGWILRKFGEVAQLTKGVTYTSDQYCDQGKGAAFLTIKSVAKNGGYKPEGIKYYSGPISSKQKLAVGDLLIANTDLTRAGDIVGCPVIVPKLPQDEITMSMDLSKVEVNVDLIDKSYLAYALMLDEVRSFMKDNASGSTVLHLKTSQVPMLRLLAPISLDEQRGIAKVLLALDEQIEATEALVAKFDATRTGLIRDLLAEVAAAPKLPLKDLADIGSGITLGREFSGVGTAEYPYLRVANVQDGRLELSEVKTIRVPVESAERVMLQPGDVLMNEGGDFDKLGRGAVWEGQIPNCLHQNHVFRVRCDQSRLLPGFLALWAASAFGKRFFILASKQSTNLASINSTQLKGFPVLSPPIEKQREILDAVEAVDSIQAQNNAEIIKLRLKKQGLMRDLLTGAVRVTGAH